LTAITGSHEQAVPSQLSASNERFNILAFITRHAVEVLIFETHLPATEPLTLRHSCTNSILNTTISYSALFPSSQLHTTGHSTIPHRSRQSPWNLPDQICCVRRMAWVVRLTRVHKAEDLLPVTVLQRFVRNLQQHEQKLNSTKWLAKEVQQRDHPHPSLLHKC
jgi:hypothetical protein